MNAVRCIMGIFLVIIGVGIIGYGLYSSWRIFSGNVLPPSLFQTSSRTSLQPKTARGGVDIQIQALLTQQLQDMIPFDAIPKTLNMSMWALFATTAFLGGGQLAGIGIKLLRP